jgi:predicted acyltransferase (DUF342 family)
MPFDKRTLVLPAGAAFGEHQLVAPGDIVLGNHVSCGLGLRTPARVFLGQGVEVRGDVECAGDLRADTSVHILGMATTQAAGYLGERCYIQGDLHVKGDLDVGDDVRVGGHLKAEGWVQKRSPVPLVLYVFLYLLELLRLGQGEKVEEILKELEATEVDLTVGADFLFVPDGSKIGLTESEVKGSLVAAPEVRILGNCTVRGDVTLNPGVRVFGALRADGAVVLARGCEVQGELAAGGKVTLGENCLVLGDVSGASVEMAVNSTVDGKIVAPGGVSFRSDAQLAAQATAEKKVEEFGGKAADLVDLLG